MRNKRNLVTALAIALALCAVPVGHGVMSALAAESGNDVVVPEDNVSKELSGILENTASVTVDNMADIVAQVGGIDELKNSMDNNASGVLSKLNELETALKQNSRIKVEEPAVTAAAEQYVDKSKIMVYGAAFSANQEGDTVNLSLDVKETPAELNLSAVGAVNAVTLDLKLNVKAEATGASEEVHSLKAPIRIVIPSPAGLSGNIVIFHQLSNGLFETIYPQKVGADMLSFTVKSFSNFVFAEVPVESSEEIAEVEEEPSGREKVSDLIESAADNATIVITKDMGVNYLSNSQMKALVKRGNVTLKMEYIYQGKEYSIVIPAGGAENNDIEWYGPLYLAAHYSGNAVPAVAASGDTYQVQKGDTLSKIAAKYGTTVNNLKALNPQIKNVDMIYTGWKLNVK
ncbi:MAG: LysM peptidoglycan-binding domain-containing protein [Acetatifactor sp.]